MRKADERGFNEANLPAKQYRLSRSRERASGRAAGQGLARLREGPCPGLRLAVRGRTPSQAKEGEKAPDGHFPAGTGYRI